MEPIYIAVIVGILVYIVILLFIQRFFPSSSRTRIVLDKLEKESSKYLKPQDTQSILRDDSYQSKPIVKTLTAIPGGKKLYGRILTAGLAPELEKFALLCGMAIIILSYLLRNTGGWSIIIAFAITFMLAHFYIKRRISKRNKAFISAFPDALDMIVRSVRSGYPLNTAVKMVAENMPAPISTEFKQVTDETLYGSSLIEALQRLSQRIDEPDIRFFVVVLAVQQEVGGNLAEVLSNLSAIIRKRKHLYLKIRALSSEGRATAWVLGLLPVFEFMAIYFVAPTHLTPLFTTTMGNIILFSAVAIVAFGVFIVQKMINIEV